MNFSNKENILFINPPSKLGRKLIRNFDCATESKGNYLYQPYDFLLLSSHIKKDQNFLLLDSISDKLNKETVFAKTKEFSPSLVIISIADSNWTEDINFVRDLRNTYPSLCIILFGDSFIDYKSVEKVKSISNGILHNPIEVNFTDILNHIKDEWIELDGFVKPDSYTTKNLKTPKQVRMNLAQHSEFISTKYRWPFAQNYLYSTVFTAWGCPYSCSYCIMAKFPNYYREFSDVLNELTHIKELGLREFYMGDRSFGLPRNNVISLLNGMIKKKLNLKWSTYFHPNQYDPELLELMAKTGCHTIIIGVETSNFEKLKEYGRHTKKDKFFELLNHAKRLKINICGDFLIGLPGESREDILNTIDFSLELDLSFASFNVVAPLAGTSIREKAIEDGRISEDHHHYDSFGFSKVLGNGKLSGAELLKLKNLANRKFYLRINYLFRRIQNIKSCQQLVIQIQEMLQLFYKSRGSKIEID